MATVSKKKSSTMMGILIDNKVRPPFWVIGGRGATVDDVLINCLEKKPDEVYIDDAYLMRSSNSRISRWERIADNAERTKQDICESLGIPVSNSYQFNRDAAKKKKKEKQGNNKVDLEDIAGADQIGQISSLVFGMFEEDSVETMYQRTVEVLKGRSGESGQFKTNWIFDEFPFMDFSEITKPSLADLGNL